MLIPLPYTSRPIREGDIILGRQIKWHGRNGYDDTLITADSSAMEPSINYSLGFVRRGPQDTTYEVHVVAGEKNNTWRVQVRQLAFKSQYHYLNNYGWFGRFFETFTPDRIRYGVKKHSKLLADLGAYYGIPWNSGTELHIGTANVHYTSMTLRTINVDIGGLDCKTGSWRELIYDMGGYGDEVGQQQNNIITTPLAINMSVFVLLATANYINHKNREPLIEIDEPNDKDTWRTIRESSSENECFVMDSNTGQFCYNRNDETALMKSLEGTNRHVQWHVDVTVHGKIIIQ